MTAPIAVLVEGAADVPMLRTLLVKKFGLTEKIHFTLHPHKGKPNLLQALPKKLQGMSNRKLMLVVLDVDNSQPESLLNSLNQILSSQTKSPLDVLFCLAIEETESWFIADISAICLAFPNVSKAHIHKTLGKIQPDAIVGAWEQLAKALKVKVSHVTGINKYTWAEKISPHLNFDTPYSPSLLKTINDLTQAFAKLQPITK